MSSGGLLLMGRHVLRYLLRLLHLRRHVLSLLYLRHHLCLLHLRGRVCRHLLSLLNGRDLLSLRLLDSGDLRLRRHLLSLLNGNLLGLLRRGYLLYLRGYLMSL